MASWTRTSDPAKTPISIDELSRHLRLLNTDGDTKQELEAMIKAATFYIERQNSIALITQTWQYLLDGFKTREIVLPVWPVLSITSIQYYDTDNAQQTFSSANYRLGKRIDDMGIVQLNTDASWPSVYDRTGAVTITFVAGYGASPSSVPDHIRQALKILAGHFWQNPVLAGDTQTYQVPMSFEALTASLQRRFC